MDTRNERKRENGRKRERVKETEHITLWIANMMEEKKSIFYVFTVPKHWTIRCETSNIVVNNVSEKLIEMK